MKKTYKAECNEMGDDFVVYFNTTETDKAKLLEFGNQLAMEWGGVCFGVKAIKEFRSDVWDCDISTDENLKKVA